MKPVVDWRDADSSDPDFALGMLRASRCGNVLFYADMVFTYPHRAFRSGLYRWNIWGVHGKVIGELNGTVRRLKDFADSYREAG